MVTRTSVPLTLGGQVVDALPACPGVYRFLDASDQPLYIGKSVNLRSRVRSHFGAAGSSSRRERMLARTSRVDARPTAGEVGALLLENLLIKQQLPVYNRRQRALRRMWSITIETDRHGVSVPRIREFSLDQPEILSAYGAWASRWQARKALDAMARRAHLCPRVLGLESGQGPCFQHQIGRCKGACCGRETPEAHSERLRLMLAEQRLSAWPITGPVLLHETAADPVQPPSEWHLLHNWSYLGTFQSPEEARAKGCAAVMFDRDTYHILRRTLAQLKVPLLCAETLQPVSWPTTELS